MWQMMFLACGKRSNDGEDCTNDSLRNWAYIHNRNRLLALGIGHGAEMLQPRPHLHVAGDKTAEGDGPPLVVLFSEDDTDKVADTLGVREDIDHVSAAVDSLLAWPPLRVLLKEDRVTWRTVDRGVTAHAGAIRWLGKIVERQRIGNGPRGTTARPVVTQRCQAGSEQTRHRELEVSRVRSCRCPSRRHPDPMAACEASGRSAGAPSQWRRS